MEEAAVLAAAQRPYEPLADRLHVCSCESRASLALFPVSICLIFLSLYTPGFCESFLPCARQVLPNSCFLSTAHPFSVGFLASVRSFSHLFPRSVSLAPRLRGSLAALQGVVFKGTHFSQRKPKFCSCSENHGFLSYIHLFKLDF